jgi:hypothetical protein
MVERTTILLIAGYIGALALGTYELQRSSSLPAADPAQTGEAIPTLEIPPGTIKSIAVYDAITERPLFNRNRLPTSKTSPPDRKRQTTQVDGIQGMRLTAVLKGPSNLTVLLENQTGETRIMHTGDKLGKWQIEEILDDRVVMVSGSNRQTLLVHRFDPVDTPRKVRRRPQPTKRNIIRRPSRPAAAQPSRPPKPVKPAPADREPSESLENANQSR